MRIWVTIGGIGAAIIVAILIWMLIPKGTAVPPPTNAASTASSPDTAATAGDGSFRVCNQTANRVSVALGYRADKGWQSEGWWVAEPSKCAIIYRGDLQARRYYYVYAADDIGGGAWDGTVFMCTRDETFTIFGVEDCLARGYERTGFFEIDTGNRPDWTLQLTEPAANPDETGTDNAGTDSPDDGTTVVEQGTDETGATEEGATDEGGTE